jgi:hypothetical protein
MFEDLRHHAVLVSTLPISVVAALFVQTLGAH